LKKIRYFRRFGIFVNGMDMQELLRICLQERFSGDS
jgi:hypothetical protein